MRIVQNRRAHPAAGSTKQQRSIIPCCLGIGSWFRESLRPSRDRNGTRRIGRCLASRERGAVPNRWLFWAGAPGHQFSTDYSSARSGSGSQLCRPNAAARDSLLPDGKKIYPQEGTCCLDSIECVVGVRPREPASFLLFTNSGYH